MYIPEDKPLYDFQDCKSCTNSFPSNTKNKKFACNGVVLRCKVWNNIITKNKCEFYSPIMVTGIQQLMFGLIRQVYPQTIRSDFVETDL